MEYNNELTHHGVLGMKWGVRRYQNKDGSLTPAGKKRRAKLEGELDKLGGNKKTETRDAVKSAWRPASSMSDAELAKAIERARMENTYNQLRPEPKPANKRTFMKQMIDEAVKPAMISSGKKLLENSMNQAIAKLTKGQVDPNSLEALKATYDKLDYKHKIDKLLNPDKYLSEEDKTKRQDREYKAEDRAAQKEGYQNAADKAYKTKQAEAAAKKAEADEAARVANEAKSQEYYNSTYNHKGGEKTYVGSNDERGLAVVDNSSSRSVSSMTTSTNVSSGRETVEYILEDSDGNTIREFTNNDDVSYRR